MSFVDQVIAQTPLTPSVSMVKISHALKCRNILRSMEKTSEMSSLLQKRESEALNSFYKEASANIQNFVSSGYELNDNLVFESFKKAGYDLTHASSLGSMVKNSFDLTPLLDELGSAGVINYHLNEKLASSTNPSQETKLLKTSQENHGKCLEILEKLGQTGTFMPAGQASLNSSFGKPGKLAKPAKTTEAPSKPGVFSTIWKNLTSGGPGSAERNTQSINSHMNRDRTGSGS